MRSELERRLEELRRITGQLLPAIEADDRRVIALLDDGKQMVIEAPQPLDPAQVRATLPPLEAPPPLWHRAYVHRNAAREIEFVDIVSMPGAPPPP